MVDAAQLADAINRTAAGDEQVQSAIRLAVADAPVDTSEAELTLTGGTSAAPIIRFVDLMISRAVQERASDIHVEPSASGLRVRYRVDGVLHEVMHPPRSLLSGLISRIKVMANLDIAEKRVPQDGRVSMMLGDRSVDLRVATVPTVHGEAVVLRILRAEDGPTRVSDLGMEEDQLRRLQDCYRRPWGLLLVTGPTGSGKTTTLYSILRELNEPTRNLLTVEDPVEYRMDGVKQIQVRPQVGLTFAAALRSMLRADPDVVLVGEIRDRETAVTAVEASLTGHLVLASIHTNDAASTPLRLLEMGVEPYLVVAGLRGVLAQRLARRLCTSCRRAELISPSDAAAAGIPAHLLRPDGAFESFGAAGCPACSGTGYRGRFAVCEYLEVSETISHLVLQRAPSQQLARVAGEEGMLAMREAGMVRVADGTTSLEELLRALG
jgi:type IV pilus assembly protein PilB